LDKLLEFPEEFLLLVVALGERFFVSRLEIVPVKWGQVARRAGRSLGHLSVVVNATLEDARFRCPNLGSDWLEFWFRAERPGHAVKAERSER